MYKFGCIGIGNMGGAVAQALVQAAGGGSLMVSSRTREKAEAAAARLGCMAGDNRDLAAQCQYLFLGVKPQILPGVVTGALMAFTMSLDDFVISLFTSGSQAQNLSVTIYAMVKRRVTPEINALSTLMFGAILLLLILVNVAQIRGQPKARPAR